MYLSGAGKRAFVQHEKTFLGLRLLSPAEKLLERFSLNTTLAKLFGGACRGREAAHLIAFLLGCCSQHRERSSLASTSTTLQTNDLIVTRKDDFNRGSLIDI